MRRKRWLSRQAAGLCTAAGVQDPVTAVQQLAASLIDSIGFDQPPFEPRVLGSFRNVRDIREVSMFGAARLVPDGEALVIEVNQDHSTGKQNFSADHEISHTFMPGYSGDLVYDEETGAFRSNLEEEYLCDAGAAALLLDPRWLGPLACQSGPSLSSLIDLAELFAASLLATARQLVALDLWPYAFVFWEEGFRKGERVQPGQLSIPDLAMLGGPALKLRVTNCHATSSFSRLGVFIPNNKSVPDSSLVAACCKAEPHTYGIENFDFGRSTGVVQLYCENWYAPYRRGIETRRRVISLLLPVEKQIVRPTFTTRHLESFTHR